MIQIPLTEIELSYARSSGPGGQNVNKVNSKAILRWNLLQSSALSGALKERIAAKLRSRLTQEGELVIASDRYRDQIRNRQDCLDKLNEMLTEAARVPKPRKKTRPSRSSERKAKELKSRHSQKKSMRSRVRGFD